MSGSTLHPRWAPLRRRLLGGGSAPALLAATGAVMLGVSLPGAAQTVIGNQSNTYTLNPASAQPFIVNSGTTVTATGSGDAIYGNTPATQWTLTNNGFVGSGYGNGVNLLQPGTVTNGGTFNGFVYSGVRLAGGGTVTNQAGALIIGSRYGVYGSTAGTTVVNAGAITGTLASVFFKTAGVTNMLTLTTGSVLNGDAVGAVGATNILNLQGSGTLSNTFTNFGTLTVNATGTWTMSQSNTFANSATVTSGTLAINNGVTLTTAAATVNGGTLLNSGTLAGAPTVTVNTGGTFVNNGSVEPGQATPVTLGGGVVVNQATITGASNGIGGTAGSVSNTGTINGVGAYGVNLTGAGTVTNAGRITGGAGAMAFLGGGTVTNQAGGTLTGVNAAINILGAPGTVTNQAGGSISGNTDGIVFQAGGTVTNAGSISGAIGAGVLVGGGSGTVTNTGRISGANLGAVDLSAGGTVTNQAGGVLTGNAGVVIGTGGGTVINAGSINGIVGSVDFTGGGANLLILQTGSVLSGTVLGSTAVGATNAVILQGTGSDNNTFTNFQTLTVNAGGLWVLNGANNSFTNGAVINTGTLEIGDAAHPGASIAGGVTLAGGMLIGHGTIGGSLINTAGLVSPGGTIGTLKVNGNFTQGAGGTLAIEINPSGAGSQLVVLGNVSLAGKLLILPDPGTFNPGQHFIIIVPSGTTSGTFAGASSTPAGLNFTVDPNQLGITIASLSTVAGGAAGAGAFTAATPNQFALARALLAGGVQTGDVGTVVGTLASVPSTQQPQALDALGGELYADAKAVGRDGVRRLLDAMGDALTPGSENGRVATAGAAGPLPDPGGLSFWGQASGHFGSVRGDGNAHGFNSSTGGGTAGLDHRFDEDISAGVALGYVHSDFSLTGVSQSGSFDQVALGGYGEKRWGRWFADGALALGYDHLDATRHVGFLGRTATGGEDGFAGGVLLKGGARYQLEPTLMLEPSLSLVYSHVDHGSLSETGATAADLAVAGTSEDRLQSILGAKMTHRIDVEEGAVKPSLRLGWAHEVTEPHSDVKESFVAIPGSGFTLTGASTGQDLALLGASVTYETTHRWSVYGRADAALGHAVSDLAVTAGFRVTW